MIHLLIIFTILSLTGYFLIGIKRKYAFWKDRKVPHVGFTSDFLLGFRKNKYFYLQEMYDKFATLPYAGFYQGGSPFLLLLDLDLIKCVNITDFSHFTDRWVPVSLEHDALNGNHVAIANGQRWKNMRVKLTPVFSSNKLKRMNILFNECMKTLDRHLERTLENSDEIDARELMQKFSMDVIGVCAYGLNCNAIEDENSEFKRVVKKVYSTKFYLNAMMVLMIDGIFPKLNSWLNLKFSDPEVEDFFRAITRDAIKNREEAAEKRDDFLQLMINVRAEEEKVLQNQSDAPEPLFTDDVCMSNLYVFFLAGYDPVATSISWCLYDLALHPDIMERLYQEIKHVQESSDETLYDKLKKMHYMDCVVSETLRLHSFAPWTERMCTKPYQIPNSTFVIEKGVRVMIPVQCIHLDSRYFPNPTKYDPERFNDENKANILPYSYNPFGDGPRMCIARRFALMEIKSALALIIGKYSVHPSPKTEIPLPLNPRSFNIAPKAVYLKFQRRKD